MKYLSLNILEAQGVHRAKLNLRARFYEFGSACSGFWSVCCECLGGAGRLHNTGTSGSIPNTTNVCIKYVSNPLWADLLLSLCASLWANKDVVV